MKLQTHVPLEKANNPIDYGSKVVVLGSCFAENMGEKLNYYQFQSVNNPFGILFQPAAMEKLVLKALQKEMYAESDIFFRNERWHCFDVHSDMSNLSKEIMLENLNTAMQKTYQHLKEASHICITLGTAWGYRFLENHNLVANCHKVPQKEFNKELLSVEEVAQSVLSVIRSITRINPTAHFIFTVSPIRHVKDGVVENQRSKAHLIAGLHHALQQLSQNMGAPMAAYFPAYEIMMDELRDYRFYAADMLHPNETAINYIWEKFRYAWISEEIYTTMGEVGQIQNGLNHKPYHPKSMEHQNFLTALASKIAYIKEKYPFMVFHNKDILRD